MARGGLFIALLVAAFGALIFADLALKAIDNFSRNAAEANRLTAPDNGEIPPSHNDGDTL